MSNTIKKEKEGRRSLKAILILSIFVFLPSSYGYESCYSFDNCCYKGYSTSDHDAKIYYYTEAIEKWAFKDGVENLAVAYNNRGEAYRHKGKYDKAIKDYDKAIELKPDYAAAYYNRGIAYDHKGQYDQAIADFTKAIALDPNHARAYAGRGIAFEKKGNCTQANQDYKKACALGFLKACSWSCP